MHTYEYDLLAKHVKGIIDGGQVIFGSVLEEDANDDNLSRTVDADSVLEGMRGHNKMLKTLVCLDEQSIKATMLYVIKFQRAIIEQLLEAWDDFGTEPVLVN